MPADEYWLARPKREWVPEWLWWCAAHLDRSGIWCAKWLTRHKSREEMVSND